MSSITIEHSFFSFCCDFLKVFYLKSGHFSKKLIKNKMKKKSLGFAPHPPGRPGAFCLFVGCWLHMTVEIALGFHRVLTQLVQACDMNVCCILGPSESPEVAVGHSQVQFHTRAVVDLS